MAKRKKDKWTPEMVAMQIMDVLNDCDPGWDISISNIGSDWSRRPLGLNMLWLTRGRLAFSVQVHPL